MQETFYNCLDFCEVYGRLPYFYITGGDPILHPDFWRLLSLIKEHEIPFTILASYVSKEQPSIADDPKLVNAFYDAPTVITMFAPKNFLFASEDCAVTAENMMLAADSLGVGSCYIGQGWTAFADTYGQEILHKWGIRTDYYAVMQLLLGYPKPDGKHPTAKPRKNDRILRF